MGSLIIICLFMILSGCILLGLAYNTLVELARGWHPGILTIERIETNVVWLICWAGRLFALAEWILALAIAASLLK